MSTINNIANLCNISFNMAWILTNCLNPYFNLISNLQGLLILYEARNLQDNKIYEIESLFQPAEIYDVEGIMGPTARLQHFDVGC